VGDEKRRVFLGEITDVSQDIGLPIVEVLDGSDLTNGVLNLRVNGGLFTLKQGSVARVLGVLVINPRTLLSWKEIEVAIGSRSPVTDSARKNWPKRIRKAIKGLWLGKQSGGDVKSIAKKILISSSKGLQLNAQIIDLRVDVQE
jgi:hypothetical protein